MADHSPQGDHEPRQGETHAPAPATEPLAGYEERDVSFRPVVIVAIIALVVGCADFYLAWRFFHHRQQVLERENATNYALATNNDTNLPIAPRLEQLDRLAARGGPDEKPPTESSAALLNTYGKTADPGYVHVPIDRAIEIVVDKLPVRQDKPAGKDLGLIDAGESNSGRMLRTSP